MVARKTGKSKNCELRNARFEFHFEPSPFLPKSFFPRSRFAGNCSRSLAGRDFYTRRAKARPAFGPLAMCLSSCLARSLSDFNVNVKMFFLSLT